MPADDWDVGQQRPLVTHFAPETGTCVDAVRLVRAVAAAVDCVMRTTPMCAVCFFNVCAEISNGLRTIRSLWTHRQVQVATFHTSLKSNGILTVLLIVDQGKLLLMELLILSAGAILGELSTESIIIA